MAHCGLKAEFQRLKDFTAAGSAHFSNQRARLNARISIYTNSYPLVFPDVHFLDNPFLLYEDNSYLVGRERIYFSCKKISVRFQFS